MQEPAAEPQPDRESDRSKVDIQAAFREGTRIDDALRRAVRAALRRHKNLGHPIVVEKDGRVVWIPAEQIPVDD